MDQKGCLFEWLYCRLISFWKCGHHSSWLTRAERCFILMCTMTPTPGSRVWVLCACFTGLQSLFPPVARWDLIFRKSATSMWHGAFFCIVLFNWESEVKVKKFFFLQLPHILGLSRLLRCPCAANCSQPCRTSPSFTCSLFFLRSVSQNGGGREFQWPFPLPSQVS